MLRESKEVPGFFEIEGFSNYLISKKAEVYSRRKKRLMAVSRNHAGYAYVQLLDDDNYLHSMTRHRLMAKVFLPLKGNFSDFQVNHIDGVPGNDWIENLEWVTPQENRDHSVRMGISTGPKISVEVRDCITGEVKIYPSIKNCSENTGLSKDSIRTRLNHPNGEKQVWPELKQYRRPEERKWYIPRDYKLEASVCSSNLPVSVRNLITNEVEHFDSSKEAAHALGVKSSTISQWLDLDNQPVLPGCIQVKAKHDPAPWRHVEDPYLELDNKGLRRIVVVIYADTDIRKIYTSSKKCADDLEILENTLSYRLQNLSGRLFRKERYMLFYYKDYARSKYYIKEKMSNFEVI